MTRQPWKGYRCSNLDHFEERVKPNTWRAFRLTSIENLSGAEAAERLNVPVSSVFVAKHLLKLNEIEQRMSDDVDWALTAADVQQHQGKLVAVYKKRMVGVGLDFMALAQQAAQQATFITSGFSGNP